MIKQVKEIGARAELITNGTLLTKDLSRELLGTGIDVLWVSLDGAKPESYSDIRLGAELPQVLENLTNLDKMIFSMGTTPWGELTPVRVFNTELGICFVAMKRNIAELPTVLSIGRQLHATRYNVSNVLPYTPEMLNEVLYNSTLTRGFYLDTLETAQLKLPRIDEDEYTSIPLYCARNSEMTVTWPGHEYNIPSHRCPFIEEGAAAIAWDGGFSPCPQLLHNYTTYIVEHKRFSYHWTIGNVKERSLIDLWNGPDHQAFRERVHKFIFPPCTVCGGCDFSDTNESDCEGNGFPTCGGCLWARGVIQCP